jgi:hypothetical protein
MASRVTTSNNYAFTIFVWDWGCIGVGGAAPLSSLRNALSQRHFDGQLFEHRYYFNTLLVGMPVGPWRESCGLV